MKDVIAEMAKTASQKIHRARKPSRENTDLDRHYRQIGISAVTAAARYQGSTRDSAYAMALAKRDNRGDAAA
jgi:hypothetical protein